MGNGEPLSPAKIIIFMVTAMISINGIAVAFTTSAINRQGAAMDKIIERIDKKMDDRYRRKEAVTAHNNLKDRILSVEARDAILERKVDGHLNEDN